MNSVLTSTRCHCYCTRRATRYNYDRVRTLNILLLIICLLLLAGFNLNSPLRNVLVNKRTKKIGPTRTLTNKISPHARHPVTCSPEVINRYNINEPVTSENRVPMKTLPFENVTSPNFTRVTLVSPKEQYALCDRLLVRIEARDNLNRPKLYGEDFFRVKLFSRIPYAAVIADRFVDYRNGTYLASFPLVWEGEMHIEVQLVHPAEAVPLFVPTLGGARANVHNYFGRFEMRDEGGIMHSEHVTCSEISPQPPFCNFSDPYVYAPFYCNVPMNPNLTCEHWKDFRKDVPKLLQDLSDEVDEDEMKILQVTRKVIQHSIGPITVSELESDNMTNGSVQYVPLDKLPYCKPSGPPPTHANGFMFRDRWYPFDCQIAELTIRETQQCLHGKTIRFYGDSTVRQLYDNLKDRLPCFGKILIPHSDAKTGDQLCHSHNTSLYFHFHGIPNGGGERIYNKYTAMEIDNITGGPGQILVFCYWAHFAISGQVHFERRLRGIIDAVHRLQKRSPDLKVVWKGTNTRDYVLPAVTLVSSDWHSYRQEVKLRSTLRDDRLFGFLNSWDITRAQPFPDNTHPIFPIIDNLVNLLLTYVCEP